LHLSKQSSYLNAQWFNIKILVEKMSMFMVLLFFLFMNVVMSVPLFAAQASPAELARLNRASIRVAPPGGLAIDSEYFTSIQANEKVEQEEKKVAASIPLEAARGQAAPLRLRENRAQRAERKRIIAARNALNQKLFDAMTYGIGGAAEIRRLLSGNNAPDINARNSSKQTALMLAAMRNDFDALRALLSHGADVNLQDKYGKTALHNAIAGKAKPEIFAALIAAGANVNIRDSAGNTPLLELANPHEEYDMLTEDYEPMSIWNNNTARILLDAGADISLRGSNGKSVSDYARSNENIRQTLQGRI
jgi:hypothetical protein